jgi:hypothetical protein
MGFVLRYADEVSPPDGQYDRCKSFRLCHSGGCRLCMPYAYIQKPRPLDRAFNLAGATGIEPATSGVTGRRSNRLNYAPKLILYFRLKSKPNWQPSRVTLGTL